VPNKKKHLVLPPIFANSKHSSTIFGTETKTRLNLFFYKLLFWKNCVNNLGRTMASVSPRQETALSFIYVKIRTPQGKVHTVVILYLFGVHKF